MKLTWSFSELTSKPLGAVLTACEGHRYSVNTRRQGLSFLAVIMVWGPWLRVASSREKELRAVGDGFRVESGAGRTCFKGMKDQQTTS